MSFTVTTQCIARNGLVVAANESMPGYAYPLTRCCGSVARGGVVGIVCRGCHSGLDAAWGGALESVLAHEGCPNADECATTLRWQLEAKVEFVAQARRGVES